MAQRVVLFMFAFSLLAALEQGWKKVVSECLFYAFAWTAVRAVQGSLERRRIAMDTDPLDEWRPRPHAAPPTEQTMLLLEQDLLDGPPPAAPDPDWGLVGWIRSRPDFRPDDLLVVPGIHVKACHDDQEGYRYHGRLVKLGGPRMLSVRDLPGDEQPPDEVVIESDEAPGCFWLGTHEQYERLWTVD